MKQFSAAFMLTLALLVSPLAYAHDESGNAPYDVQFLDTMSQHHRDGIKMMDMALDKAQSQQIKDKAQMMRDDQQKEIPELKSMRDQIESNAPEAVNRQLPGMMSKEKMEKEMQKLESLSGSTFDHTFLDNVIKHHQGAIDMSKAELKSGKSQDVKDKAQEIIDKQTKEAAELKQMRDAMKK